MRLSADDIVNIVNNSCSDELETKLHDAQIPELREAASKCDDLVGLDRKDINKIFKKKLIAILQEVSTDYLIEEILQRINMAVQSGDIDELHTINEGMRTINKALTNKWPGNIEQDRLEWTELLRARRIREIRDKEPLKLRKPKNCPKCGRQQIKRIVFGMPIHADRLYEVDNSDIEFAGCIVESDRPNWRCVSCGHRWFDPNDPARIEADKAFDEFISTLATSSNSKNEDNIDLLDSNKPSDTPNFEIIYLPPHRGKEVIEIRKDGKPFWENIPGTKKHYRFGNIKARMLMACIENIKQFHDSDGQMPDTKVKPVEVQSDKYELSCLLHHRVWRQIPYLEIEEVSIYENPAVLKIGLMKSEAIIELSDTISGFALRHANAHRLIKKLAVKSSDEQFSVENTDYWFKIVEFLQQNWGVIEVSESGVCTVYFFGDTSGVFDQLEFDSVGEAEEALRRNGFARYEEDKKAQKVIAKPKPRFHRQAHPNGPIYSSGKFWE